MKDEGTTQGLVAARESKTNNALRQVVQGGEWSRVSVRRRIRDLAATLCYLYTDEPDRKQAPKPPAPIWDIVFEHVAELCSAGVAEDKAKASAGQPLSDVIAYYQKFGGG